MRARLPAAAGFVALLFVSACAAAQSIPIDRFFDEFTDEWMRANPTLATLNRYFTGAEQERLERQVSSPSIANARTLIALRRRALATLASYPRELLTPQQRLSAQVMQWQLQTMVDREAYLDYSYPLEQFEGANIRLVWSLTQFHPLGTRRDVESYLAALAQVAGLMDEAVDDARTLEARGVVPPRFILEATIAQMNRFVDGGAAKNTYVTVLDQKMQSIEDLTPADRARFRAKAEALVARTIEPAWRAAVVMLQSQIPKATDVAGLWRLPGGDDAYRYFLRLYTTTAMSPAEIHALGLERVAAIEQQMDEIFRGNGRDQGTVQQRIDLLKAELAYPDPTSEASRAAVMRDLDAILDDAQLRAQVLFDQRPKARVIAAPYPAFEEANQAARSMPPAPDGSRPGVFMFPRRVERMTTFGLRTLTYHETVPGHFYQVGLLRENTSLPRFRQLGAFGFISAFGEGWALYAERLAAESGWYDGDPQGLLGQLDAELFRARRLVVDTGIHAMHWTRQQAIDYGIEASEVDRYVVQPGQACAYMIGQLKILELRERAKQALGTRFSLTQFHNVVLDTGTVPLDLLEQAIEQYINGVLQTPGSRGSEQ